MLKNTHRKKPKTMLQSRLICNHLNIFANLLLFLFSDDRGIEWISLTGFISFATSTPNNLGLVRNELQLVDLPTGQYLLRNRGWQICWGVTSLSSYWVLWQNQVIKRTFSWFCSPVPVKLCNMFHLVLHRQAWNRTFAKMSVVGTYWKDEYVSRRHRGSHIAQVLVRYFVHKMHRLPIVICHNL